MVEAPQTGRKYPDADQARAGLSLEAAGISRGFRHRPVLRNVSFRAVSGNCLAIFGPNGAGKTTLIRILSGLLSPDSGRILLDGHDLRKEGDALRPRLGVLGHRSFLYDALTAGENLRFYATLYGIPSPEARIDHLLDWTGLSGRRHDLVGTFSRGMQQRLSLSRALLHDPDFILLDEPFSGLDPEAARRLRDLLEALKAQGRLLCLATHDLAVGYALASHALVLSAGRLVYHEPTAGQDPAAFPARYASLTGSGAKAAPGAPGVQAAAAKGGP